MDKMVRIFLSSSPFPFSWACARALIVCVCYVFYFILNHKHILPHSYSDTMKRDWKIWVRMNVTSSTNHKCIYTIEKIPNASAHKSNVISRVDENSFGIICTMHSQRSSHRSYKFVRMRRKRRRNYVYLSFYKCLTQTHWQHSTTR